MLGYPPNNSFQRTVKKLRFLPPAEFKLQGLPQNTSANPDPYRIVIFLI